MSGVAVFSALRSNLIQIARSPCHDWRVYDLSVRGKGIEVGVAGAYDGVGAGVGGIGGGIWRFHHPGQASVLVYRNG